MKKNYKNLTLLAVLLFWCAFSQSNTFAAENWWGEHDGDYTNTGTATPNDSKDLDVSNGKLTNTGTITVKSSGSVNAQSLENSGTITNQAQGTVYVEEDFTNKNTGSLTNKGTGGASVDIGGDLTNSGQVDNTAKDSTFSVGGNLNNTNGHVSNENSDFSVDGDVTNTGKGSSDSSIQNSVTKKANSSSFTVGGNFTNDGANVSNQGIYVDEDEYNSTFGISGQLKNTNGGSIDNELGEFTVEGAIKNETDSSITNSGGSFNATGTGYFMIPDPEAEDGEDIELIEPEEGYSFENAGSITNERSSDGKAAGKFNVSGTFKNNESGEVDNSSEMTFGDTVENDGTIKNSNGQNAKGAIVQGTLQFDSDLKNKGTIENGTEGDDKRAQLTVSGDLTNEGSNADIENQGKITVEGDIKNVDGGTITNGENGRINAEDTTLYNAGNVENSGNITVNDFYNGYDGNYYDEEDEEGNLPKVPPQNGKFHNQEGGKLTVGGVFRNGDTDTLEGVESKAEFDNDGTFVYGDDIHNGSGANSNATFKNGAKGKIVSNDPDSYEEDEEPDDTYYGSIYNGEGQDSTATFENEGDITLEGDIYNYGGGSEGKGGTFNNSGKLTVSGEIDNGGTFNNSGELTITGDFKNLYDDNTEEAEEKGGLFTNTNKFTIEGAVDNSNEDGKITNSGELSVTGDVTNGGTITNQEKGNFTITGGLENTEGGNITNSGTFSVTEDVENGGTITNKDKGNFTVEGELKNTGKDSKVENEGTFTVTKDLTNEGTVTNKGDFTVKGDITINSGTITNENKFTAEGNITNNGAISNALNAEFNTSEKGSFTNNGTVTNAGTFNLNSDLTGNSDSTITNTGTFNLNSDASGYEGKYDQTAGETTVAENSKFFGGDSSFTGGILNWFTKEKSDGGLTLSGEGTTLNVGGDNGQTGEITFGENSSLSSEVATNIHEGSKLTVEEGGNVTLGEKTDWKGEVNLTDGELTLDGAVQNGKFSATKGKLKILKDFIFKNVDEDITEVKKEVEVTIEDGVNATLKGAKMHLDDSDEWKGTVTLDVDGSGNKGELDIECDFSSSTGNIVAHTGKVNFKENSKFNLTDKSEIEEGAEVSIGSGSNLTIKDGGSLTLDDGDESKGLGADEWKGNVHLQKGGTLKYGFAEETEGTLQADAGDLYLLKDSKFALQGSESQIKDEVNLHILKGSTIEVKDGATLNLDGEDEGEGKDEWFGTVKVTEGGTLKTEKVTNPDGGILQQDGGTSEFKDSDIYINGDGSYITGGKVTLNNSTLKFGNGSFNADDLDVSDGSTFGIKDGSIDSASAKQVEVGENSNFEIDVDGRHKKGDEFKFGSLKANGDQGKVTVSDFGLVGGAPVNREVKFQLFNSSEIGENIEFGASDKLVNTPIGRYGLKSLGGGAYSLYLHDYNPQVFRGQVTTLAMYNNQIAIDDMLLNHIILQSQKNESTKTANKYAAVNPLFAPYQYTREDGGLWYKSYVDIERLSMTQNLNVNNTAYGSLIGADLPLVHLKDGWDFIPTFFIGYNGSHQSYSDVSMYQNGGQGGFMGTFMKNDFIGSILAYGGGYLNEMNVEGFTDKTGNWFAGTAAKAAYNFHPSRHFIIQPTAMVAYNAFGKQSWGTDYGAMSMNSGMMNGISVAPGMNLIYARDTWSLYATFQYLFNINDHVGGHAGEDVNLPQVSMRHGYIQYGLGATKTFKERLNSYFQFVIRNGGRTGVGFQFGLEYLFDWNNIFSRQTDKPAKKAVVKDKKTEDKVVPVNNKTQKPKKVKKSKSTDPIKAVKQSKPSDKKSVLSNFKKLFDNTEMVKNSSDNEIIVTPNGAKRTVIKELKK